MSITEDFTVSEKQMIKELANKAREKIHSNWKAQTLYGEFEKSKKCIGIKRNRPHRTN